MTDSDPTFEADADAAFALFELAASDLPTPTAIRREMAPDPEIAIWTVQAKGGVIRMKVASTTGAAARVRRGAALLPVLAAQGLRVPEPLRVVEQPGRSSVTVALERRLGTTNAQSGWPILGTVGRVAFAEALANALLALHRCPLTAYERLIGPESGREPSTPAWRAMVEERLRARVSTLKEVEVLSVGGAALISDRLLLALSALPTEIESVLCHGAPVRSAMVLERRVFAGVCDFETACRADPWMDVSAAWSAIGEPGDAPPGKLVAVYAASVGAPPDLESRLELYAGMFMLRMLAMMARDFPSDARTTADHWVESWSGASASLSRHE